MDDDEGHDEAACTDEHCPLWDEEHSKFVHWSPSSGRWLEWFEWCPDCEETV